MNKLLESLPTYYHDIIDFVELTDTEEVEVISAEGAVQRLFDDEFVMTSNEQGVKRREKMLGIQADPKTESLEFRKKRIINRYSTKPPFTIRYLQQRLDFLVGPGRAITSVDVENFILTVTANIDDAAVFREVEHTIKSTKPANMIYQQNTALEGVIALEEHIDMKLMTWNYKLDGSWQLGAKPFVTYGPEVPIT